MKFLQLCKANIFDTNKVLPRTCTCTVHVMQDCNLNIHNTVGSEGYSNSLMNTRA